VVVHTNLIFDQPLASLPIGFVDSCRYAAAQLDATTAGNFINNVQVGFGELNGMPIDGALALAMPNQLTSMSYQDLLWQLTVHASNNLDRQMVSNLPKTEPADLTNVNLLVTSCQKKAWNLQNPNDSTIDGYVGISSQYPLAMDLAHRAAPGAYDLVSIFEHEETQEMGRLPYDGVMRLLSFQAPGQFAPDGSTSIYLSADNGQTNLGSLSPIGDRADLLNQSQQMDPFYYVTPSGVQQDLTLLDKNIMSALGFAQTGDVVHFHCGHHHHRMQFVDRYHDGR